MVHGILQFTPSIAFATFFIDARAEISVAESHFLTYRRQRNTPPYRGHRIRAKEGTLIRSSSLARSAPGLVFFFFLLPGKRRRAYHFPTEKVRKRKTTFQLAMGDNRRGQEARSSSVFLN